MTILKELKSLVPFLFTRAISVIYLYILLKRGKNQHAMGLMEEMYLFAIIFYVCIVCV